MSHRSLLSVSLACILSFAFAAEAAETTDTKAANTPITRAELPGLVRDAIMNDPDMIVQALKKMREKQMSDAKEKAKATLASSKDAIYNSSDTPVAGNTKDPDVTVVEFFDYHCGYCKQLLPNVTKLIGEDKKVRVLFKEFPILSEDSALAARAALAVNRVNKDKYFAYHTALMKQQGKFTEDLLLDLAKQQGVDPAKVKAEMAKPDLAAVIDKNREVARSLGISGTPGLIIGNEILPGALDYDQLKHVVTAVRNGVPLKMDDAQ